MISDGNILRFLHFLFIIFFLLVYPFHHTSANFENKNKIIFFDVFHSSSVLTDGGVKNLYRCAWFVYPAGVKLLLVNLLKMKFCFNLCTFHAPL